MKINFNPKNSSFEESYNEQKSKITFTINELLYKYLRVSYWLISLLFSLGIFLLLLKGAQFIPSSEGVVFMKIASVLVVCISLGKSIYYMDKISDLHTDLIDHKKKLKDDIETFVKKSIAG